MDGLMSYGKEKKKTSNAAWYKKNKEHRLLLSRLWYKNNKKKHADSVKLWALANPEKIRLMCKKSREKLKTKRNIASALYRLRFPEKIKKIKAEYVKNNPAINNADCAKRNAAKIQATPIWADLFAIKDIYLEAQYQGLHVDHIVPLRSKIVCGLHVWDNLQLLTKSENCRKSNAWVP